jgi:hypothetical protein
MTTSRIQALMLANGFLVMIVGMLSGFMLTFSLLEAVALALPRLELEGRRLAWVGYGLIATAWGNACFYVFSNFAPNRGLTVGANRFGESSLTGLLAVVPALTAAVLVLIALTIAARAALRAARA